MQRTLIMKSKINIYCLTSFLLSFVLLLLRCLALSGFYNSEIGYFTPSLFTGIKDALYIISALWCATVPILIPKNKIATDFTPNSVWLKGASAFCAVLFLFSAVLILRSITLSKLALIGAITAAISALFFILSLFGNELCQKIRAFTSICLIASLSVILATLYFDMTIAMNSPHKLCGGFTLMASMVFALCETRTYLGKPLPRLHLTSGLLTFMLGMSFSLSSVIYVLISSPTQFASNPILLGNIGHIGIIIGISVYAIARCFAFNDEQKNSK